MEVVFGTLYFVYLWIKIVLYRIIKANNPKICYNKIGSLMRKSFDMEKEKIYNVLKNITYTRYSHTNT